MSEIKLTILASGSAGNCALLEAGDVAVLVDAGLSGKRIAESLAALGRNIGELSGVLLTHEHGDHTAGLPVLANRFKVPLYANELTIGALQPLIPKYRDWRVFKTGEEIDLGALRVESFAIPHDAYDPVGFVARASGVAVGFLTDLGYATKLVLERVRGCDALLLEANYDLELLRNDTKRPWPTKQRIMARHGHLSNEAAAGVLAEIVDGRLRQVFLGHKSADCNTHELAEQTVSGKLQELGVQHVRLLRTYQEKRSETIKVQI